MEVLECGGVGPASAAFRAELAGIAGGHLGGEGQVVDVRRRDVADHLLQQVNVGREALARGLVAHEAVDELGADVGGGGLEEVSADEVARLHAVDVGAPQRICSQAGRRAGDVLGEVRGPLHPEVDDVIGIHAARQRPQVVVRRHGQGEDGALRGGGLQAHCIPEGREALIVAIVELARLVGLLARSSLLQVGICCRCLGFCRSQCLDTRALQCLVASLLLG